MTYSLGNICNKNYRNRTTAVEIVVGDWVAYFFATQCIELKTWSAIIVQLLGAIERIAPLSTDDGAATQCNG